MRFRYAFLLVSWTPFALVQACGGDDASTPTAPDGSASDGTLPDGASGDSSPQGDSSPPDDGSSDSSVADAADTAPPGIMYECSPDSSVSDCSMCAGKTQACAFCGSMDASARLGVCTQFHSNCFNAIPSGAWQDCPCNMGDASTCIESYQVCTGAGRCHTCSDQNGNDMRSCQGGGTCNYNDGGCY